MRVIEAASAPGTGRRTGDDRYGFDEGAGAAWVIDGATGVSDLRLFDVEESDAAWYAAALSRRLLQLKGEESLQNYFAEVIRDIASDARAAARFDLEEAPRYALPSAAGMWLQVRPGESRADLAWLGDCVAIVRGPSGVVEAWGDVARVDVETAANRAWLQAGADADIRREKLQAARATLNTPGGYWIFSTHPEAADRISTRAVDLEPGTRALLATDGFYRLVTPIERYDPAGLLDAALEKGVAPLLSELRDAESEPDAGLRYGFAKPSDDATGMLLAFD